MPTINQLVRRGRKKVRRKTTAPALRAAARLRLTALGLLACGSALVRRRWLLGHSTSRQDQTEYRQHTEKRTHPLHNMSLLNMRTEGEGWHVYAALPSVVVNAAGQYRQDPCQSLSCPTLPGVKRMIAPGQGEL